MIYANLPDCQRQTVKFFRLYLQPVNLNDMSKLVDNFVKNKTLLKKYFMLYF